MTEEWKDTLWQDLDVETMDMECKKLSKEIRSLDKGMREWHTFKGLELHLKNLLTSFRAIGSLQNTAVRERHWQQLVKVKAAVFHCTAVHY